MQGENTQDEETHENDKERIQGSPVRLIVMQRQPHGLVIPALLHRGIGPPVIDRDCFVI
mgnify:CR=1 FL=1